MIITWIDRKREPQCPPDPAYPLGVDLDLSEGMPNACKVSLPYPARRCGAYVVECPNCGTRVICTTAGRVDDPRSVKLACKRPLRCSRAALGL
jgi:hypothetical protein